MTKTFALAAAAVSLVATTAAAQPTAPSGSPLTTDVPALKSESSATAASVAGTLVPIAMLGTAALMSDGKTQEALGIAGGVGLALGPSAGHWYSGKVVTKGLFLRGAGVGVAVTAFIAGRTLELHEALDGGDHNGRAVMYGGALVGSGLVVAGIIHDIATADDAARDYNRKHARTLTIAPTITRESTGFAIAGTF